MLEQIRYNPAAAHKLLKTDVGTLKTRLETIRQDVFADVDLLRNNQPIPTEKKPLDSGFIDTPQNLLEEYQKNSSKSLIGRIQEAAQLFRNELEHVVFLGIGGSYMGARALFEALLHPYHNQLPAGQRKNTPRYYFEGNNIDTDAMKGLMDLLQLQCSDPANKSERWGTVVISKSGGTIETAVAFRFFREALEKYYGSSSDEALKYVIPVTGEEGKLRNLSNAKGYPRTFPIPDGVGGRFSVLTAVGLLPAAILGLDIVQLLQGAADQTEQLRSAPYGNNVVLDYVATCHLMEQQGCHIRILSTWGARLEALGFWYDQLLSESLGKAELGATPITGVNTRDLHSRGQQHQEGRRDKLITNVIVEKPQTTPLSLAPSESNQDELNQYEGKSLPTLLSAAIEGTNKAYADADRPTADLLLPKLNEYVLGQVLQMFMLATVVEGRLIGVNPYGQPGVEDYKNNMKAILGRSN